MIVNPNRGILNAIPGLNGVIDKILANLNGLLMAEHNQDGSHSIIHERDRVEPMGTVVLVPYLAANFTANSGATWTVALADQVAFWYALNGMLMTLHVGIQTSSLTVPGGSTPDELRITLPNNFIVGGTQKAFAPMLAYDAGTLITNGIAVATPGKRYIEIHRGYTTLATTFWTASADQTEIYGSISFVIATQ